MRIPKEQQMTTGDEEDEQRENQIAKFKFSLNETEEKIKEMSAE